MTFIDVLIWSFRMKTVENCMSLSNAVLSQADAGKANRGEYKSGRWARGSWLRREKEEQIGALYLLSTSAFKPEILPETFLRDCTGGTIICQPALGLTTLWLGHAVVSLWKYCCLFKDSAAVPLICKFFQQSGFSCVCCSLKSLCRFIAIWLWIFSASGDKLRH